METTKRRSLLLIVVAAFVAVAIALTACAPQSNPVTEEAEESTSVAASGGSTPIKLVSGFTVTNADGTTEASFDRDANGNLIHYSITEKDADGAEVTTTSDLTYDEYGMITGGSMVDSDGHNFTIEATTQEGKAENSDDQALINTIKYVPAEGTDASLASTQELTYNISQSGLPTGYSVTITEGLDADASQPILSCFFDDEGRLVTVNEAASSGNPNEMSAGLTYTESQGTYYINFEDLIQGVIQQMPYDVDEDGYITRIQNEDATSVITFTYESCDDPSMIPNSRKNCAAAMYAFANDYS